MSAEQKDSKAMPPPPLPAEVAKPKILSRNLMPFRAASRYERRHDACCACLMDIAQDAMVKAGQIYGFYADARRLGVEKHISNPPRSLTAGLGRDIERYDQLCDSIEAHLASHNTPVLKRDLRREEQRIAEEEKRKNAEAMMLPPPVPDTTNKDVSDGGSTNPRNSPVVNPTPSRRASVISISSLHRPQFPLKLDLSSSSLRISEEEAAMFSKGLGSPVTLAPKSARPMGSNEFPPDLIAAFTSIPPDNVHGHTIDLTLPSPMVQQPTIPLGVGLGDSSDKPIELDLDSMDIEMSNMNNLFGGEHVPTADANAAHDGLFSPALVEGGGQIQPGDENNDFDMNADDDLFGDFTAPGDMPSEAAVGGATMLPESTSVPSPGSLLAQFSSTSHIMNTQPSSNPAVPDGAEGFDIHSLDLTHLEPSFFGNPPDSGMNFPMDMDAFLNMSSSGGEEKTDMNLSGTHNPT
ncbi:hypothetical protein NLJ89_g382 [Agrocybe chaxingu]|uniref:Uncharacterized protein n=1 Tax=Agrocybe chaxingu TaxID=84603 RepID=A0A9W8TGK3_9AGAR|nr:hypothetical protein NLJ89_g382 [Agrocybe chaxingu]